MEKQEPEAVGVLDGRTHQRLDAFPCELALPDAVRQVCHGSRQNRPVQVGLGVEVAIEEDLADACFQGNVVEVRCLEPVAGEGTSRRRKQLVSPIRAVQSPPRDHARYCSATLR